MLPWGPEGKLSEPVSPCWLDGEPLLAVEPDGELELDGLGSDALLELELEVEGLGSDGLDWLELEVEGLGSEGLDWLGLDVEGLGIEGDDGEDDEGEGMLGMEEEELDELVVSQPARAAQRAAAAITAASGRCWIILGILLPVVWLAPDCCLGMAPCPGRGRRELGQMPQLTIL